MRSLTSSNDDLDLEVVSIGDSVVEGKFAALKVRDAIVGQLRLPLLFPILVAVGVVLGSDDDASLIVGKVGDNVAPMLVVVDAQSDDEVFASVGHEAKGTAGSAATHGEHMGPIYFTPRSTVGILPNRLLDDVEEGVLVGLVDLGSDGVTHSREKWSEERKKRRRASVRYFCCRLYGLKYKYRMDFERQGRSTLDSTRE